MVGNDLEITLLLTLGTLTNDLMAHHGVRAKLVHVLRGSTKHVDATVDKGIRSTAITKRRLFDQIEIIFFLAPNGESKTSSRAACPASFSQQVKIVLKLTPSTSMPCFCIKQMASMLSSPPESNVIQRLGMDQLLLRHVVRNTPAKYRKSVS